MGLVEINLFSTSNILAFLERPHSLSFLTQNRALLRFGKVAVSMIFATCQQIGTLYNGPCRVFIVLSTMPEYKYRAKSGLNDITACQRCN
jgi:hypothetical protein